MVGLIGTEYGVDTEHNVTCGICSGLCYTKSHDVEAIPDAKEHAGVHSTTVQQALKLAWFNHLFNHLFLKHMYLASLFLTSTRQ